MVLIAKKSNGVVNLESCEPLHFFQY